MDENNDSNGKVDYLGLVEYHLRSVGINPNKDQTMLDYVQLIPKVQEAGLVDNDRQTMRVAAEALQAVYHTRAISEKEERGEELTPLDRLQRYYTMTGPPKAHGPTPGFERDDDDVKPFDRINEYYKRNKP